MTAALQQAPRWVMRPLICLLGIHRWQAHPSSRSWRYCRLCGAEQNRRAA